MKVNLDLIAKMVEAGASGSVILAYLQEIEAKRAAGRPKDKLRKRADRARTRADKARTPPENVNRETILSETPRARLFREGVGALITLGIKESRARPLIAEWLKITHDDEQLVLATILKAQQLNAADPPGWILEALRGKTNGNRAKGGNRQSGGADFFAGLETVAADIAGHGAMGGDGAEEIPLGRLNIEH